MSLKDIQKKIREGSTVNTFSRTNFDEVVKGLLNDKEYTVEVYATKGGETVKKEINPSKALRQGFFKKILTDAAGLDKHEAEAKAESYNFSNVDGLYEFIDGAVYAYLETGKKFNFQTRKDFKGSVRLTEVESETKTRKVMTPMKKGEKVDPKSAKTVVVKTDAHKKLRVKSSAPDWLKHKQK